MRRITRLLVGSAVIATLAFVVLAPASTASALGPVNPVRVDIGGHPANSGFLVFVEGDVALSADESEGTLALGGDLTFTTSYNISAHTPAFNTFTAPGDSGQTGLFVGGGVVWPSGGPVLKVMNDQFTKIADTTTYTAGNVDGNGATGLYQVRRPGQPYGSTPRIEGTTSAQDGASIASPVPGSLIDIPAAFTRYRELTADLAACAQTVRLTNPDSGADLQPGWPAGTRGRLTLTPGQTNVLTISAADLANLGEIAFAGVPSADTPLLVNVTGSTFSGSWPNQSGISGAAAPYLMWNFPTASAITVTGGDSVEGTLYAPNAHLAWEITQNIEGNVIAASFTHGRSAAGGSAGGDDVVPLEIHDVPFRAELSCTAAPSPSPSPSSPVTSPSPSPSPTSPSPSPSSPSPSPSPTDSPSQSASMSPTPTRSPTIQPTDEATDDGGNGDDGLAFTGFTAAPLIAVGLTLVGAGVVAVLVTRRRRS